MTHKSFRRKLDWFKSKMSQNDEFWVFFGYLDKSNEELLTRTFKSLKHRYKPYFKRKTKVKLGSSEYLLSWSFETEFYDVVNEKLAKQLVFRVQKGLMVN